MSIAIEIHRCCRAAVAEHANGRLKRVTVAIGELAAIEPDLLTFAWEAVVADGPDADCRLEVQFHPARQRCPECGDIAQRVEGSWLRLCPQCGQPLQIEGGEELDVLELELALDDVEAS